MQLYKSVLLFNLMYIIVSLNLPSLLLLQCFVFLYNSQNAEEALSSHGVQVIAHDKCWAEEKNMGSFLSVTRGSDEPPVFLEMVYKGGDSNDKPVLLVGKKVQVSFLKIILIYRFFLHHIGFVSYKNNGIIIYKSFIFCIFWGTVLI